MSEENSARAFREEGSFLQRQGRLEEAEEAFFKALDFYGAYADHETLFSVAELFLEKKGPSAALDYYVLAIRASGGNRLYKQRLLDVCGTIVVNHYNSDVEEILLACLQTAGLDFAAAGPLWLSVLQSNPAFVRIYADRQAFEKKVDTGPLLQPFFIEGLKRVAVYDTRFEDFIRRLRQWILLGLSALSQRPTLADYLRLAEAVAAYCSFGEYIVKVTPAEEVSLRKIAGQTGDPPITAVRACYIPAEKAAAASDLVKETKITDGFSLRVKEHYEEFSSPYWRNLPAHTIGTGLYFPRREKMERTFAGAWPELLVAGCGTGREALMAALHYPKGKITAIDLSRANLEHAARKSQEYNITNITFRQDDILNLAKEMKVYDIVYANGVLHDMQDPLAGWKILWDRLKPAGIMKVGLYSKTGRRTVVAVGEVIKKFNISDSREVLRDFRSKSADLLSPDLYKRLIALPEYYNLFAYRDLFFKTDAPCLTLPEIEENLKKLRLSFTGFDLPSAMLGKYSQEFPDDKNMVSLKNWHQFEEGNPETFSAGYHFWCRKF